MCYRGLIYFKGGGGKESHITALETAMPTNNGGGDSSIPDEGTLVARIDDLETAENLLGQRVFILKLGGGDGGGGGGGIFLPTSIPNSATAGYIDDLQLNFKLIEGELDEKIKIVNIVWMLQQLQHC